MIDVHIRPYQDSDLRSFRWLYERTPPAGQVAYEPQSWPEHLERPFEHLVALWVATHSDGERTGLVGTVGLEHVGSHPFAPPVPEFINLTGPIVRIHEMRTAPEVQRQGIGTRLMEVALDWARARGYESVILETTPQQEAAVAFYRAMGFSEAGRSMIGRWELVWFRKTL